MHETSQPLVSIIVITYNSSKYVLETLESAKAQTYQNIELIVSDDASQDNTVEICKAWLEENSNRFARVELVITTVNTGVSPNCNRGLESSIGDWIKLIAGDDVLEDQAIYDYINFSKHNSEARAIFGLSSFFYHSDGRDKIFEVRPFEKYISFFDMDPFEQLKMFTKGGVQQLEAPSFFIKKDFLIHLGSYNEDYPFYEDYPLYLTILESGNKLYLLRKNTVFKRFYKGSVSNKNNHYSKVISPFEFDVIRFNLNRRSRYNNLLKKVDYISLYLISYMILSLGNKGKFFTLLYKKRWMFAPNSFIKGLKLKLWQ